jgi:hypothetical protein
VTQNHDDDLITTSDAARLTGRTVDAVRGAIKMHVLTSRGKNDRGYHLVLRTDLLEWHREHPPTNRARRYLGAPWDVVMDALAVIQPATPEEVAGFVGLHPGNARKHLSILAAQGRVAVGPDRQWTLTNLPVQEEAAQAS